jgi:sulfur-oxidizing protein SoxX
MKKMLVGTFLSALLLPLSSTTALAGEMVTYQIQEFGIQNSLTGKSGDPANGKKVAINRKLGNCLACHKMPVDQPFQGDIGPSLTGVAGRYSEAQLRLRVVNSKIFNPMTIMPAFYKADDLNRVLKDFKGKTMLTPQQVEDVVAYLKTLR